MTTSAPLTACPRRSTLLAWAVLLLVLTLGLPLFLCMPLWFDVLHYDLCARTLFRGGALYRDAFDNNLPGIIWLQAAVRAALGWRPEALHLADLIFMALGVLLLLRWVPARDPAAPARVWTATALALFYLFSPEFGHCQRDGWMLLPAAAALCRRDRLSRTPAAASAGATVVQWAVLEGLFWGAAFWIKPFVIVPALACWLVGALAVRRSRRVAALDAAGLLAGGLLAGGLGLAYLAASGTWHSFWEILLGWNSEYASWNYGRYPRSWVLSSWAVRYFPWSLVHVPALATALAAVTGAIRRPGAAGPMSLSRALLGAFYLGWLVQAVFIQRPHDYVMTAALFPAVVLVAGAMQVECRPALNFASLGVFVLLVALLTPGLRPGRLTLWARCCREGSTPELRDRLALNASWPGAADWQDLVRVADFLRAEGVGDGELTCLSGCTHPLYLELGLEPSTRFHQVGAAVLYFPSHAEQIRAELEASRSRYVVTDLAADILTRAQAREEVPGSAPALPASFPPDLLATYPWREPLVFRTGRYVVHRVRGPVTRPWYGNVLLAARPGGYGRGKYADPEEH
jgi:hypothetical protein